MAYNKDAILGIFLSSFSFILYLFIIPWQCASNAEVGAMSPAFFPKAGTILLIVLSLIFTAFSVRRYRSEPKPKSNDAIEKKVKLNVLFAAVSITLYLVSLDLVGFLVATPLFLMLLMISLGARLQHWMSILITTAVTTIAIYYFFIETLGLPMP